MLKRVTFLSVFAVLASLFMFSSTVFASPSKMKPLELSPSDYQVRTLPDGTKEIKVNNAREFLMEQNVEIPSNVKEVEVLIQDLSASSEQIEPKSVSPSGILYYIKTTGYSEEVDWGTELGPRTAGSSGTISMAVSKKLSATFSSNTSVTAGTVSSGVGYNVTAEYSVENSTRVDTYERYTEIAAYPVYGITDFDVFYTLTDKKAGIGYAMKPKKVLFKVYRY